VKRALPIVAIILVLVGVCWWFSYISDSIDSRQSAETYLLSYSQTATAEAPEIWNYYSDPDSEFSLILPSSWRGMFVAPEMSSAKLLTIQKYSPNLGLLLEQVYKFDDKRPLLVATGDVPSSGTTFQFAQLYVLRDTTLSVDASSMNQFSEDRISFLKNFADEVSFTTLEVPSNRIFEFSYCTEATESDPAVCITEYHIFSAEVKCLLDFATSTDQNSLVVDGFRSIAEQVKCR
jgi:hypothetical protein